MFFCFVLIFFFFFTSSPMNCDEYKRESKLKIKSLSSHLIYPLTTRVVEAPQMISQPVSSIFPCSPLLSGTWRTPGLSIPWSRGHFKQSPQVSFWSPLPVAERLAFWNKMSFGTEGSCKVLHSPQNTKFQYSAACKTDFRASPETLSPSHDYSWTLQLW